MFDFIWNGVMDKLQGLWDFVSDPIWRWYFFAIVGIAIGGLLMWFVGWLKFVRVIVGTAFVLGMAFLAGGYTMHREMKQRLDEEKERRKTAEGNRGNSGSSGGGWWPFQ